MWTCLVGGLHSESERVECAECWRCGGDGGPRSRVPAPPGAGATTVGVGSGASDPRPRVWAYRLAGSMHALDTTLHVPHWMSQKTESIVKIDFSREGEGLKS